MLAADILHNIENKLDVEKQDLLRIEEGPDYYNIV